VGVKTKLDRARKGLEAWVWKAGGGCAHHVARAGRLQGAEEGAKVAVLGVELDDLKIRGGGGDDV
jgi:hypothetical protein